MSEKSNSNLQLSLKIQIQLDQKHEMLQTIHRNESLCLNSKRVSYLCQKSILNF